MILLHWTDLTVPSQFLQLHTKSLNLEKHAHPKITSRIKVPTQEGIYKCTRWPLPDKFLHVGMVTRHTPPCLEYSFVRSSLRRKHRDTCWSRRNTAHHSDRNQSYIHLFLGHRWRQWSPLHTRTQTDCCHRDRFLSYDTGWRDIHWHPSGSGSLERVLWILRNNITHLWNLSNSKLVNPRKSFCGSLERVLRMWIPRNIWFCESKSKIICESLKKVYESPKQENSLETVNGTNGWLLILAWLDISKLIEIVWGQRQLPHPKNWLSVQVLIIIHPPPHMHRHRWVGKEVATRDDLMKLYDPGMMYSFKRNIRPNILDTLFNVLGTYPWPRDSVCLCYFSTHVKNSRQIGYK